MVPSCVYRSSVVAAASAADAVAFAVAVAVAVAVTDTFISLIKQLFKKK